MENNLIANKKIIEKEHPKIHIASYRDISLAVNPIDVTSRSKIYFGKQLSPFYLGPVSLYEKYTSANMENAWQYSKVYKDYIDPATGNPSDEYFAWAERGWKKTYADRHPKGKEIPLYSWWNGEKLDYIQARKKIYIPLYSAAVLKTQAFKNLQKYCTKMGEVTLIDFDGYDFEKLNMNILEVINEPNRRMGHAFVLWMLLNNIELTNS